MCTRVPELSPSPRTWPPSGRRRCRCCPSVSPSAGALLGWGLGGRVCLPAAGRFGATTFVVQTQPRPDPRFPSPGSGSQQAALQAARPAGREPCGACGWNTGPEHACRLPVGLMQVRSRGRRSVWRWSPARHSQLDGSAGCTGPEVRRASGSAGGTRMARGWHAGGTRAARRWHAGRAVLWGSVEYGATGDGRTLLPNPDSCCCTIRKTLKGPPGTPARR